MSTGKQWEGYGLPGTRGLPPGQGSGGHPASHIVREEELLRLLLTGMTVKEAASYMRCSYNKVRSIAKDGAFLLKLREHSAEIAERLVQEVSKSQIEFAQQLEAASEQALEKMIEMMHGMQDGAIKYKICQDLMDRDPRASRTKRLEASTTHDFISPAVLIHAAATAKELSEYHERRLSGRSNNNTDDPPGSGDGQG